jgi:hypothetical protein
MHKFWRQMHNCGPIKIRPKALCHLSYQRVSLLRGVGSDEFTIGLLRVRKSMQKDAG